MAKDRFFVPVRKAKQAATQLIDFYGISEPSHIRLEDICFDRGAEIVEGPLTGAAARLVTMETGAIIRVAPEEPYPHRKRFSIAHELGHLVLKHGHGAEVLCSDRDLLDWYGGSDEAQANAFATELLLPKAIIAPRCDVSDVTFDPVRKLADAFRTSLTSTAMRFVEFCPEECALVFSTENKVRWFFPSEDWRAFIPVGSTVDERTLAARFFKGERLPEEPDEVFGDAWVDGRGPKYLIEHSIGAPRLGFVLTLLWVESED